ncbi:hypothetical protein J6590_012446 [Homalodisca vitripennis]|nr:hypothetical protein J6590_012446 [Homalodisca vitripennis]
MVRHVTKTVKPSQIVDYSCIRLSNRSPHRTHLRLIKALANDSKNVPDSTGTPLSDLGSTGVEKCCMQISAKMRTDGTVRRGSESDVVA